MTVLYPDAVVPDVLASKRTNTKRYNNPNTIDILGEIIGKGLIRLWAKDGRLIGIIRVGEEIVNGLKADDDVNVLEERGLEHGSRVSGELTESSTDRS